MTILEVVISKHSRKSKLVSFTRRDKNSPLTIKSIDEFGTLSTPLLPGMVVTEINGREATWLSPKDAQAAIRSVGQKDVSICVVTFTGEVLRQKKDESVGLLLRESTEGIFIWEIKEGSKFMDSDLKAGMKIIAINGEPCPSKALEAGTALKQTIGSLMVTAVDLDLNRPRPITPKKKSVHGISFKGSIAPLPQKRKSKHKTPQQKRKPPNHSERQHLKKEKKNMKKPRSFQWQLTNPLRKSREVLLPIELQANLNEIEAVYTPPVPDCKDLDKKSMRKAPVSYLKKIFKRSISNKEKSTAQNISDACAQKPSQTRNNSVNTLTTFNIDSDSEAVSQKLYVITIVNDDFDMASGMASGMASVESEADLKLLSSWELEGNKDLEPRNETKQLKSALRPSSRFLSDFLPVPDHIILQRHSTTIDIDEKSYSFGLDDVSWERTETWEKVREAQSESELQPSPDGCAPGEPSIHQDCLPQTPENDSHICSLENQELATVSNSIRWDPPDFDFVSVVTDIVLQVRKQQKKLYKDHSDCKVVLDRGYKTSVTLASAAMDKLLDLDAAAFEELAF